MDKVIAGAEKDPEVHTLAGRFRPIPEVQSSNRTVKENGNRMAINTIIQGSAADIIKMAMIRIHEHLRSMQSRLVLQVHDELVFEYPAAEEQKLAALVRDEMEHAVALKAPLQVSLKHGANWADMTGHALAAMKEIDAAKFKEIIKRGMEHLFRDRDLLNRINVFPVADGDTGDNLVHTLRPVYEKMDAISEARVDNLTAQLAQLMLMSAKGNSGVIFSQFFFSFAEALQGQAAIAPADFSLAMEKAVHGTYESIASPEEGTILTVLRHTAEEFKRLALSGEKYHVIFEKAIIKAREILEKTRDILPQMKKARVVDAGGMGFYLFFKGMAAAVQGRGFEAGEAGSAAFDQKPRAVDASELAFCAEWVLRPHGRDRDFFKELLAAHGDSLLIAGDCRPAAPAYSHRRPRRRGERARAARGDRLPQGRLAAPAREPGPEIAVALLMDSAVDIPAERKRPWRVTVVPLQILLNDRYVRDRVEIGKEELYRRMRAEKDLVVKTSQPAPLGFQGRLRGGAGPPAAPRAFLQPVLAPERLVPERAGGRAPAAGSRPGEDPHRRHAQRLGRQRPAPLPRPAAPGAGHGRGAGVAAEIEGRRRRRGFPGLCRITGLRRARRPPAAGGRRRHPPAGHPAPGRLREGKAGQERGPAQRPRQGKKGGAPLS